MLFFSENIVGIGTDDVIAKEFQGVEIDKKIDASGCCILPGKNCFRIHLIRTLINIFNLKVLLMHIHIQFGQVIEFMNMQKKYSFFQKIVFSMIFEFDKYIDLI